MKFKKPTQKSAIKAGKMVLAFAAGKRASRGVAQAVTNSTPQLNPTYRKLGVVALGLGLAMTYSGSNKDIVYPLAIGIASEQITNLIDGIAKKSIPTTTNPNDLQKVTYAAMGLKCPCNNEEQPQEQYQPMALNMPELVEVDWNDEFQPNTIDTSFEEVPVVAYGDGAV